jgi:hypothetical protein
VSVEPPWPQKQDSFGDDSGPDNFGHAGGRGAETVAYVKDQEQDDIRDEGVLADAVTRSHGPSIDPNTYGEHQQLHD